MHYSYLELVYFQNQKNEQFKLLYKLIKDKFNVHKSSLSRTTCLCTLEPYKVIDIIASQVEFI